MVETSCVINSCKWNDISVSIFSDLVKHNKINYKQPCIYLQIQVYNHNIPLIASQGNSYIICMPSLILVTFWS